MGTYNSLPNEADSYQFLGWPQVTGNPNSNNFATSLLVESGISKSQVNSYQRQLFFDTHRFTPGLGVTYTTPSYQETAQARLNSALNRLSNTLDKLSKSLKK